MIRVLTWPAPQRQLNPYTSLVYRNFVEPVAKLIPYDPKILRVPDVDIFHIHWPEAIFEGRLHHPILSFLKAANVIRTINIVKRRRGCVVLTFHNSKPHRSFGLLEKLIWKSYFNKVFAKTDVFISLSNVAVPEIRRRLDGRPATIRVIKHPHYKESYPAPPPTDLARIQHNIPSNVTVVAMIGSIRSSKNVDLVISTFLSIAKESDLLLIAGDCSNEYRNYLERLAKSSSRIKFIIKKLDDDQMSELFSAANFCLINQTTTLNSGTALLSLSLHTPIIAPEVGSLVELRDLAGNRWVRLFKPPLDGHTLRKLLDDAGSIEGEPFLKDLDPSSISQKHLDLFAEAIASGGRILS